MSIPIDLSMLTPEEVQEECLKLFAQLSNVKKSEEDYQQEIFELKRNLKISKSNEEHLNQELENLLCNQNSEVNKVRTSHDREIKDLWKKYKDFEEDNINLTETISALQNELKTKQNLYELRDIPQNCNSLDVNTDREIKLEYENLELMKRLDECQDDLQKVSRQITEKERQIEILIEQLQCVEENLSSKREELEEKTSLLESAQEQMVQMNAELALLRSSPESNNRKGNSLFAEVDDQRQVMKTILAAQKKSYLEMRKAYNASEHEIRRLKRLNTAMYSELQACTAIFLNAEKTYKEKLNDRIIFLLKKNEELEKKLKWGEEQLVIFFKDKGINWMDSMLEFCKNETHEYKAQLHSTRMQKSVSDHNLYNAQQELSKWRFEALGSRCILIERESLLEENSIKFKKFSASDFQFEEKHLKSVTPNIFPNTQKKKMYSANELINFNSQNENELNMEKSFKILQIENYSIKMCTPEPLETIDIDDTANSSIIEIEDTAEFQINLVSSLKTAKLPEIMPDGKNKNDLESKKSLIENADQNAFNANCDSKKYSNQSQVNENFISNESEKKPLSENLHSESLSIVCEQDIKNILTETKKFKSPKKLEKPESKKIQTSTVSSKEKKSILAKQNKILRQNELKYVKFNENEKHAKSETDKYKTIMKKPNNVIMKKIVIKSNTGNTNVK